ncbi:uncharacterized protein LOC135683294 [Rhopilema esculentum]|uniref:uncharacterized protein LOC135683294 n=1 Tax=Rhopilema esculentum TaxID=499914 RepID=UPI0031DCAEE8
MANQCKVVIFISLSLFAIATGLSFEDSKQGRENYYNFIVESRANGKRYDGTELREKCKDRLAVQTCNAYKPLCSYYRIIREMCAESCGQCKRTFQHIHCSATKFGCCWDNFTKAAGPNKEECPACIDMHGDCKYLKDRCAERAEVRRVCPVTCGVPCQNCADDPHQSEVCPYYKMAGFCQVDPVLMRKHCKKTCGFCR